MNIVCVGVSFTNVNNGTAVGSGGIILRTSDGGQNWFSQTSGTTNFLYGVSFIDINNGIAVGGIENFPGSHISVILKTTNGGTTWTSQAK